MISAKWLVLWSLWAARLARQPTAPLRVSGGRLRGSVAPDGSHAAYLAVPYAKVTPENRFKDPGPEPKWDGTFEAYNEHIMCLQRFGQFVIGQEDCLVLNIYTPLGVTTPLPVLVFIHGGGFWAGSGSIAFYGPQYLVRHGVILVTMNYRLDVMGFLSLGTKDAPGNAGLKDQVAALKWVKRNIRVFGGDPDNVTLFGESAGAVSVSLHLVSPMSKGLFHKAIMQSGTALVPWSIQYEPINIAKAFVKNMGYETENVDEIYRILMTKPVKELISTRVPRKKGTVYLSEYFFLPCVEEDIQGVEPFLTDTPYNLISNGQHLKMPLIIGYNIAEGYLFTDKESDTTIAQIDFAQALPEDLSIANAEEKQRLGRAFRRLYTGGKEESKATLEELAFFEGDISIRYPVIFTIDFLLKNNLKTIFAYRFDYDGWLNFGKWTTTRFKNAPGASHGDELFYMFKPLLATFEMFEREMLHIVTSYWTNFAKFGDPTPEASAQLPRWPPADSADPRVLVIDQRLSSSPLWADEKMRFWNQTYSKYRRTQQ